MIKILLKWTHLLLVLFVSHINAIDRSPNSEFAVVSRSALQRCEKICSDLQNRFGDLSQLHIVQIRSDYGIQYKALAESAKFAKYIIVDSVENIKKTQEVLANEGISSIELISFDSLNSITECDLVLCSLPFSGLNAVLQQLCIDEIIPLAPRGYMIWIEKDSKGYPGALSLNDLIVSLWQKNIFGAVLPEERATLCNGRVITWNLIQPPTHEREVKFLTPSSKPQPGCAVTYDMSGGRLGDNLITYLHAKWISYKYNIPLLFKPFSYSDQLMLSCIDQQLTGNFFFNNQVLLINGKPKGGGEIDRNARSTLYTVPYFGESEIELEFFPFLKSYNFSVDWHDLAFRAEIIQAIQPISQDLIRPLPYTDRITVAVHVRTGVGFDTSNSNKHLPFKFPPHSFYIQQIRRIAEFFKGQPLYLYLFTDDPNPSNIVRLYESILQNPDLKFIYRENGNHHKNNVLEDMFSLAQCDCLIRGESNFSLVPSKINDYMFMITPAHHRWDNHELIIDQVNIFFGPKRSNPS